ncbi:hypothetical protein GCM10022287_19760 [Gryllotalpicola koreensis]|uniref:Uncharacterized protein n=1 Tax=Gryllotalpicola koreensis TaxID=993086 RepID=A0ABP8A0L1_9MICO
MAKRAPRRLRRLTYDEVTDELLLARARLCHADITSRDFPQTRSCQDAEENETTPAYEARMRRSIG